MNLSHHIFLYRFGKASKKTSRKAKCKKYLSYQKLFVYKCRDAFETKVPISGREEFKNDVLYASCEGKEAHSMDN